MSSETRRTIIDPARIDEVLAPYNQGQLPGMAVGIAVAGRPVYRKGFGLASMELPLVLSPTIRLRIGSTTKHFAALAYMLLVEEGRAGLDDEVRKHIPEMSKVADGITMRQLMGHTSGLRCSLDLIIQLNGFGRHISSAEQLDLFARQDAVNFPPGTRWSYNNGGYLAVSIAIERITGQRLEDVFRERIFEPIGMADTMLRRVDTDFVPNSATLHMPVGPGKYVKEYMGVDVAGEGGMVSTVDDMLRWLAHMDRPVVGTAATWAEMRRPMILANGHSTGYGLGLVSGPLRGVTTLHHGGAVLGGVCQMIKVIEPKLDIVLLANRSDVDAAGLADKLIGACVPDLDPAPEDVPGTPIIGLYYSEETGSTLRLVEHEGRQIMAMGGVNLPTIRAGDGSFRPEIRLFHMVVKAPPGVAEPAEIRYSEFGVEEVLRRIEPEAPVDATALAGRYRSDATGTTAVITPTDQGAILQFDGRWSRIEYDMKHMGLRLWQLTVRNLPHLAGAGGTIEFDADHAGFDFSAGRTRRLRFERIAE